MTPRDDGVSNRTKASASSSGGGMPRIRIVGGHRLDGRISICGAKNAALPLMTASLLTDQTLTLRNLPRLADIATLSSLLAHHGVAIEMNGGDGDNQGRFAHFHAAHIADTTAPYDLVRKMRASVLVLGPIPRAAGRRVYRSPAVAPSAPGRSTCTSRGCNSLAQRSNWTAAISRRRRRTASPADRSFFRSSP